MIGFQINGEYLDMPADPSVDLQRQSPLFQFEGFVQEDYTLPIRFPNSPKNKRIFDFPHIIENASRLRPKWDAVLYYNGVPRLKGEIRAKSPINKDFITANFVAGLSLIGNDVKERKLSEIIDETIEIHNQTIFKSIKVAFITSVYKLKINGNPYDETDFNTLLTTINSDPLADYTASGALGVLLITMDIPGEFVPFHVEVSDESFAGVIGGSARPLWLTQYQEAYADFVTDHLGASRLDKKVRMGTYGNNNGFASAEKKAKAWPIVNYIVDSLLIPNDYQDGASVDGKEINNQTSFAPMLTVKALLEAIETYYGITINFYALNDDDVLFSPWTLDVPTKFYNDQSLILWYRSFNLNQLVPDITVNDFLKSLQVGFNAFITYDPDLKILNIDHRQPFITARTYEDITLKVSEPSDIQLATQKGIRFALQNDNRDKVADLDLAQSDFLIDEAERTIQAGFGTYGMRVHTSKSDWPQDAALLTIWLELTADIKFPLRFARYIDATEPYLDARPFLWEAAGGLIDNYWSDSISFENNPITIKNTWLMPRNDLFETRWGQRWRIDRNDYLLREYSVGLKNNGVTAADCVFVRLPSFVDGAAPEPPATAWRVLESSLRCEKNVDNINTGQAIYDFLEQITTGDNQPTGVTKLNAPSDPDYIAPVENLVACPVSFGGYTSGNLYIIMNPAINSSEEKVRINGVEYTLRTNGPNPFPYPHPMGATTQVSIVTASNPKSKVFNWKIEVYQNADKIAEFTRTVGPNNQGPPGTENINLTYRTVNMGDSLFDELKINRIIITRTEI